MTSWKSPYQRTRRAFAWISMTVPQTLMCGSPTVDRPKVLHAKTEDQEWMTPIWNYLYNDSSPEGKAEVAKVENILNEIHKGIYGFHSRGRTMATQVLRAGYYWPTMREDCRLCVHNCQECQAHDPIDHFPAKELQHVIALWTFST
ncbi:hypothetical protein CR513_61192, partial [Mucuna pruriens]